jgi:type IV secretory pathway ATPase VirB11/archaellum biosynthesis ATPase
MADDVIRAVNRSNQRGGRMLSLVDLIEAETFTVTQAAWATERIEAGASFLVGAMPGGAGKTAVMGALLTMLPPGERVQVTHSGGGLFSAGGTGGNGWRSGGPGDCLVAYEISPASYEAYIWGSEVQAFVERGLSGARLVANLHADTLKQAYTQLTDDNGVAPDHFDVFDLFVPISMGGGFGRRSRVVEQIDYRGEDGWQSVGRSPELSSRAGEIGEFLEDCRSDGVVTIEEVRRFWLRFLDGK